MHRSIAATLLLFATGANAFAPPSSLSPGFGITTTQKTTSFFNTALSAIRCENKSYQLEEMEDAETCTTEVFLNVDRTITFGQTDGPVCDSASGNWQVAPGTNNFSMTIRRRYSTGSQKGEATDVGEFKFDVTRVYQGEMTLVGESVGITGIMKDGDTTFGEAKEVGFFNMIDGSKEKASYGVSVRSLGN